MTLKEFPVKARHLLMWTGLKVAIWAILGGLWLHYGHFPWRAVITGEIIAYGPIPIYFLWVGWMLLRRRQANRARAALEP